MAITAAPPSVSARATHLLEAKRRLKAEIQQKRKELQGVATALTELEAECRRNGLSLIIINRQGVGGIHGHDDERTRA